MYNIKTRTFEKSGNLQQLEKNELQKKALREKFAINDDWLNKSTCDLEQNLEQRKLSKSTFGRSSIDSDKSIISEKSSKKRNINDSWVFMESQSGGHKKNTSEGKGLEQSTIYIGDRIVDLGSSKMERDNFKWGTATVHVIDRKEVKNNLLISRVENNDMVIIEREVKDLTSNKGTAILMKLELMARVVDVIYTGVTTAFCNWNTIICGVTGIMGGGAQMISLNPYNIAIGGVRVAASVKTMYDAYSKLTATQIEEMIEDSKASIDAIKLLAEANEESLERVKKQLLMAQGHSKTVQQQLEKIAVIKGDASTKVLLLKEDAEKAYALVDKTLDITKSKITEANKMSTQAQKGFAAVVEFLGTMILLFNCKEGTETDRLKALAELTQKIFMAAEIANRDMQEAQKLHSKADEDFNKVIQLQSEAAEAYGRVDICQQMTIEYMADAAKKGSEECKLLSNNINSAGGIIVNEVALRNEAIRDFAKEAADTLGDLIGIQINENRMGLLKLFVMGISAFTFNIFFGSTTSIILAAAFVNYANTIANFIADFLARKVAKESTKVQLSNEISYEFDCRSEYLLNRARGKVSQDKGTLSITVGNQYLKMRFDLSRKYSIRQIDLLNLGKTIRDAVVTEKITIEKALELIKVLKTADIQRKTQNLYFSDKNVNKTGFIAKDSVVMKMLENFLNEKMQKFQNFLNGTFFSLDDGLAALGSNKLDFDEAEFAEESEEEVLGIRNFIRQ